MKKFIAMTVLSVLALTVALPAPVQAAEGKEKEKKASSSVPFNGKITAVDATAKTITLSGKEARVVHITSSTKIQKDGKPATFDDAKVGEEVGGAFHKNAEGKMEATSVRLGAKPEGKGDGEGKGKGKAKGKKKDGGDDKK